MNTFIVEMGCQLICQNSGGHQELAKVEIHWIKGRGPSADMVIGYGLAQ